MIHRFYKNGGKLDVAGLNRITVLLDRSETELTEIGWNEWRPGLVGPPHSHRDKEQLFFIMSGQGVVEVGSERYAVKPKNLIYIPAGAVHRSVSTGKEPLSYILFNVFLNQSKEGHATFRDHIEKVKHTRKLQAETGMVAPEQATKATVSNVRGKYFPDVFSAKGLKSASSATFLALARSETCGFELLAIKWPAQNKGNLVNYPDREQTYFVVSGSGNVTVGDETASATAGDLFYVPRNTPHSLVAGSGGFNYLCLNCYSEETQDKSFEEAYRRITLGNTGK